MFTVSEVSHMFSKKATYLSSDLFFEKWFGQQAVKYYFHWQIGGRDKESNEIYPLYQKQKPASKSHWGLPQMPTPSTLWQLPAISAIRPATWTHPCTQRFNAALWQKQYPPWRSWIFQKRTRKIGSTFQTIRQNVIVCFF